MLIKLNNNELKRVKIIFSKIFKLNLLKYDSKVYPHIYFPT